MKVSCLCFEVGVRFSTELPAEQRGTKAMLGLGCCEGDLKSERHFPRRLNKESWIIVVILFKML